MSTSFARAHADAGPDAYGGDRSNPNHSAKPSAEAARLASFETFEAIE
jgi:hypothetical protein